MAELARLGRVSRARITQIMDLLMLAPEIQEDVLGGREALPLQDLILVVRHVCWADQRRRWRKSLLLTSDRESCALRGDD